MKILQVIYSLVPGGAERFVVDLTNELAANNETVLYTIRDDTVDNQGFYTPEIHCNVNYKNLKIAPGFKIGLIWSFYKIIKKERPDVVHCHLNLVNYFFLSSFLLHKKTRFIYTIHNSAETEIKSKLERHIRRFFFKHKFFIPVAISDETKSSYTNYYRLNDLEVIVNGRTSCEKSIHFNDVKNEIAALKPTDNTLVFCHVARFDEIQKNQTMLISVFNQLKKEGFDIILLIMGEGFENAIDLVANADGHIHFLGLKTNVPDYLFLSDGFCLSSNFEGMPISLIEAFACGCVPICTPVGGTINFVKHGLTGFLSNTVSETDYLQAVKQFITSRDKIKKESLIEIFYQNFSIEYCAGRYQKLYEQRSLE